MSNIKVQIATGAMERLLRPITIDHLRDASKKGVRLLDLYNPVKYPDVYNACKDLMLEAWKHSNEIRSVPPNDAYKQLLIARRDFAREAAMSKDIAGYLVRNVRDILYFLVEHRKQEKW